MYSVHFIAYSSWRSISEFVPIFVAFFLGEKHGLTAEKLIVIKYYVRHGKMEVATLSKLKEAYGDKCLAKLTVLKLHAIFVKDLNAVHVGAKPVKWQERLERCVEHWSPYFEKAGSEKIDIETDVSDSE